MRLVPPVLALLLVVPATPAGLAPRQTPSNLPSRLSDQEFWALSQDSSEPGGLWLKADIVNVTSNELLFQQVMPDLIARVKPGGVYLGVGPEQNFSYIAATQPRLAVILDIRRGNLDLQLTYKAIFELSKDRAAFLSMLFSQPRPPDVSGASTADELFDAFAAGPPASRTLFVQHLAAIKAHLTRIRSLPLPAGDLEGIEAVYERLFLTSSYSMALRAYRTMMTSADASGVAHSFLASESRYAFVKTLQDRNLVVPVVGDFAGPKALRAIAEYLKSRDATVSTFYVSNVEEYLTPDATWPLFCRNITALPLDPMSTFVRARFPPRTPPIAAEYAVAPMMEETRKCPS